MAFSHEIGDSRSLPKRFTSHGEVTTDIPQRLATVIDLFTWNRRPKAPKPELLDSSTRNEAYSYFTPGDVDRYDTDGIAPRDQKEATLLWAMAHDRHAGERGFRPTPHLNTTTRDVLASLKSEKQIHNSS